MQVRLTLADGSHDSFSTDDWPHWGRKCQSRIEERCADGLRLTGAQDETLCQYVGGAWVLVTELVGDEPTIDRLIVGWSWNPGGGHRQKTRILSDEEAFVWLLVNDYDLDDIPKSLHRFTSHPKPSPAIADALEYARLHGRLENTSADRPEVLLVTVSQVAKCLIMNAGTIRNLMREHPQGIPQPVEPKRRGRGNEHKFPFDAFRAWFVGVRPRYGPDFPATYAEFVAKVGTVQ